MSASVFQSDGSLRGCPAAEIGPGGHALWRMRSHADCLVAFDAATGIAPSPRGAARWFGRDLASLPPREVLATLRRMAPLSPGGGLVGNIRVAENILLPSEARGNGEGAARALSGALASAPWSGWFPENQLWALPYQTGGLGRALAGVLRAWLVRPEAVVACEAGHFLEAQEREILASAISWLRAENPSCAWLFIQTESALPAGFGAHTLAARP